ncbi:hypothetical protein [Klebsiella quasipneumoniae]|uniref:hypothetical protein n=1 Tax=Klebsiella quasipneumoniae TaxID=1463165 RepID=UPI002B0590DB|nr:hypothetical protein [Klebsiella quasipneumoniae]
MTTDITELAQRVEHIISDMKLKHGDKDTYAPVMKWDEFLALVEALEKAQAKADVYDMLRDDYGLCEKGVGLTDFVDWQAKRIAELESHTVTVKLPHRNLGHDKLFLLCPFPYYDAEDMEKALADAGIKVEAE